MSTSQSVIQPLVLVIGSRNRKKCKEMAELIAPPWELPGWAGRLGQPCAITERMLPTGSANHAISGPPCRLMPLASVTPS